MAVGENTTGQGKAHGASSSAFSNLAVVQFVGISALSVGLSGLSWAQTVANNDLPTGATVAAGVASVGSSGAAMTIRQGTERAIINWQSFNIGKDATVSIVQPGSQSVLLNRVTGESPSQILGQLSANGQVVLVNPNGMTFGKDGSVSAASFTASTLGISDASFMSGDMRLERNGSRGQILNQGRIATHGGYVALLGANVSNEGRIETRGSAALLGAAETIQIPLSGSGRVKLELTPAQINASVGNTKDGVIITEGGQVYMQAAAVNNALASITQSGSIDTSATAAGNEMGLRQQYTWDVARKWYTVVHVKGQLNSGRLDSYNQLALGGVDGVRAYTSVDGVGDRGFLMNLELNRRLDNGMTVGAFYDVGSVRLLSANSSTEYGGRYTLQALGMQWSVNDQHWFMNASVAKGLGGYKAWTAYNIESTPNNWRVYGSLTYRF